jgi:short-subunit dehydrogenase
MARREITGLRTIVTGASSGIGRAIAVELARQGARLILTARREARLREICEEIRAAGGVCELLAGDITDPAARQAAIEATTTAYGGLDLLVNNAGVGAIGRFDEADPARLRRLMEVNFFAAVEMIRDCLPALKAGTTPMIVNVASILGQRGIPLHSEYCASKFALRGFSQSLRTELLRDGIDLLIVSPGTTETDFFDHLVEKKNEVPWKVSRGVPAERVARSTVKAIRKGKHEIIPSFKGKLLCFLNRASTLLVDRLMARYR